MQQLPARCEATDTGPVPLGTGAWGLRAKVKYEMPHRVRKHRKLSTAVTLGSFDYALARFAQDDGGATALLVLTFGCSAPATGPVVPLGTGAWG